MQNPTVAKDCSYKPESIEFLGILSIESEKHQPCLLQWKQYKKYAFLIHKIKKETIKLLLE